MKLSAAFPKIAIGIAATTFITGSTYSANLLAYYEFEGNYNSTGGGPASAPSQNPGQVSFAAGFRGQAADLNDPDATNNSGGSIDIPINANPGALSGVTFGGWVNIESYEFDGFMAIDNGGWDRGITVNAQDSNSFGIASGAAPVNVGPIVTGTWQYVVGTFNKPGNATLFVGNADPGVSTTPVGVAADLGSDPGEPVIEIGRYDNQDLDGLVDDIFVFGQELTDHEVNAIRNLRLTLDISPYEANELFELYSANAAGQVGGLNWSLGSGLDATNPGAVLDLGGGQYGLVLDGAGNGLVGVPEPAVPLLACVGALFFLAGRRRR